MDGDDYSNSHYFLPATLQSLCLVSAINNLEFYPPKLLSCVPVTLRYRILSHCPVVDVCRLEKTSAFNDINSNRLWGLLCDNIWKRARFEDYIESYVDHISAEDRYKKMLTMNVSNREKCFALLTTAILCAERPCSQFCAERGYPHTLDTMPQEWLEKYCPADVVNFLVCSHNFSQVEKKVGDVDDSLKGYYFACTHNSMLSKDELEEYDLTQSAEDALVTYKNQHIPPRYMYLMQGKNNMLRNEDALSLIMDECNYYPDSVILDGFEMIQWRSSKEEIQHILEKFLHHLKKVKLHLNTGHGDITGLGATILLTCLKSTALTTVSASLDGDLSDLVTSILALQHPDVSELNLKKLTISRLDTSTTTSCKLLTIILECHSNICELKFNRLHGELPNNSDFMQCMRAIIRNPSFVKLSLKRIQVTMKLAVELLTAYLSTPTSHSQELCLHNIQISGDNSIGLPCSVQHASDNSALEFKSVQWSHLVNYDKCHVYGLNTFCNWLLSFQPMLLNNLRIKMKHHNASSSLPRVSNMLQIIALNPAMRIQNLTLNEWDVSPLIICEEHLEAVLKHPSLRSFDLGIGISSQSLGCLANALRVQHQLASLEHLSIVAECVQVSDIEAFFGTIFVLPQITQFSLCFTFLFFNNVSKTATADAIYQIWLKNGSKKLRKFQLLCSNRKWTLSAHPEDIVTMDVSEMQLAESN